MKGFDNAERFTYKEQTKPTKKTEAVCYASGYQDGAMHAKYRHIIVTQSVVWYNFSVVDRDKFQFAAVGICPQCCAQSIINVYSKLF